MLRLFLAIPLSQERKEQLTTISSEHRALFEKANWVKEENYHITLFFLGMVEEGHLNSIIDLATQVSEQFDPFELEYEGLELKPKRNPRIFWLRFKEHPEFNKLCLGLGRSISKSIKLEKQPNEQIPHITLARVKSVSAEVSIKPVNFPPLIVDRFELFKSELLPAGPIYTGLKSFPLLKGSN